MPSLDELHAAILAAPQDLGARMVYGDALAEVGDPRGELFALQSTLATAGVDRLEDLVELDVTSAELSRLAGMLRRARQLIDRHRAAWLAPLSLPASVQVDFQRGMPEVFTFKPGSLGDGHTIGSWLARIARVTTLGELRFHAWPELAQWPSLPVTGLRAFAGLGASLDHRALMPIAEQAPLRRLHLERTGMVRYFLEWLARSPQLSHLRFLTVSAPYDDELRDALVELVRAQPALVLSLPATGITDDQVIDLVTRVPALRGLEVHDNPIGLDALRALVALPELRYLGFRPDVGKLDKTKVGSIIAGGRAPLRSLILGGAINDAGLVELAGSPVGATLRALDLRRAARSRRRASLGKRGLDAIAALRLVRFEVGDVSD